MRFIFNVIELYRERTAFFLDLLLEHIYLTGVAILFITIIGVSLGVLMTYHKGVANTVLSLTNFFYTIPSIAMFGFLVTFTGIGNTPAIIALTIYGVLPVIRNTYVGISEIDDTIIEAATGMGVTVRQLLFKIQLPLALPVIIAGFRTMVIMTIALGGIASFIGAGGLGIAIWRGISNNHNELIAAGSLLVALLAVITDLVLNFIERGIRIKIYGTAKER